MSTGDRPICEVCGSQNGCGCASSLLRHITEMEPLVSKKTDMISTPKNESYSLEIAQPLLRSGLILRVGPFSKKHAVTVMRDVLQVVREFNDSQAEVEKVI